MSLKLMAVALDVQVGNPLRKLVLLKMCDNANDQGVCWPSFDYLAKHCEISKRSVVNHIEALIEAGFLLRQRRTKNGKKTSNVYLVNLSGKGPVGGGSGDPKNPDFSSAGDAPLDEFSSAGDSISGAGDALGSSAGDALKPVSMNLSKNHIPPLPPIQDSVIDNPDEDCPQAGGGDAAKKNSKKPYPDWFESLWRSYPQRSGANDKRKAFHACRARLGEGESLGVMVAGMSRYAVFLEANRRVGTQYVMQAATFFGPGGHIHNPWRIPDAASQQRFAGGRESVAERISRQTREILSGLEAGEAGDGDVGAHDAVVRSSVG